MKNKSILILVLCALIVCLIVALAINRNNAASGSSPEQQQNTAEYVASDQTAKNDPDNDSVITIPEGMEIGGF